MQGKSVTRKLRRVRDLGCNFRNSTYYVVSSRVCRKLVGTTYRGIHLKVRGMYPKNSRVMGCAYLRMHQVPHLVCYRDKIRLS